MGGPLFPIYAANQNTGFATSCPGGGRALGYFLGGYVPPGTPNWHPVLEKISPKNGPIFYTPFLYSP